METAEHRATWSVFALQVLASHCLWQAPEVIKRDKYGISADVFSFGCVQSLRCATSSVCLLGSMLLAELYTGQYPFDIMENAPESYRKFDEALVHGETFGMSLFQELMRVPQACDRRFPRIARLLSRYEGTARYGLVLNSSSPA